MAGIVAELGEALLRLDRRLEAALQAFETQQGGPVQDRFRGLYITPQQIGLALGRRPGAPAFDLDDAEREPLWAITDGSTAAWIARTFELSAFELDVLLIALAPEYDLRYERLYAYLQDDVTRKRPTVDLALSLLTFSAEERLAGRATFSADAPLRRHALLQLLGDPQQTHPPLLAQYLKPDAQILRFLLGDLGLDERLLPYARLQTPKQSLEELHVDKQTRARLSSLAETMRQGRQHLWLHGPAGIGKNGTAAALAGTLGGPLLNLDARGINPADAERTLNLAMREAWLRSALLYVAAADTWIADAAVADRLAERLTESPCSVVFGGEQAAPPTWRARLANIELPTPDAPLRARCWRAALAAHGRQLAPAGLQTLANLFRLTPAQIEAAAADADLRAGPRAVSDTNITTLADIGLSDCAAAAREQSRHLLAGLAERIDARATWDDIVLPDDALAQLRELCQRVEYRERVLHDWGFARRSSRGLGTAALFAGPSGTGKTMAAEVIANALGLDLYRIDLAGVVSKYIGETEKNLDKIFAAAENDILFFDEADALFGKRSEVRDSHDRYANLEISYLLQKMEQYPGITILATNLRQNLDEAFVRRLAYIVQFPFPDEAMRRRILDSVWPATVRLDDDVQLDILAKHLKFSGGSIRNIALAATFLAAHASSVVQKTHVMQAADREARKFGKSSVTFPTKNQDVE
jgi:AAA+ superfamily predicted ATPase